MASKVNKPKIALVILAAGESKRMGVPKQLLPWKDSTLLGHAIRVVKNANLDDIYVVLGAHQQEISKNVVLESVQIISNPNWKTGMAGSIACALSFFKQNDLNYDGLLIGLCDQPLLEINHFNQLISRFNGNKDICVTSYGKGFGVPALFGSSFFSDLHQLRGHGGAKKLMLQNTQALIKVDCEGKTVDLDTLDDYTRYYEKYGK